MSAREDHRNRSIAIFAALAAGYSASQFYRASPAVIAPDLMRDLALSSEAIGGIAGAFFLAFGLAQIPVGILLDRFGPRRSMSALFVVAVLGAMIFAMAQSGTALAAGRAILGIGCAAGLMGAMVVFGRWFSPEKFATMSGLMLGIGSAGVLLAATPLAMATASIGWRGAFFVAAGITAFLAILLYAVVRDAPPDYRGDDGPPEGLAASLGGVWKVMQIRPLWRIIVMQLTIYPSVLAIAALWAGPYLSHVHGLDTEARGNVLNVLYVALVVSPILFGPLDRVFNTRKRVVIGAAVALVIVLSTLALWPQPALWQVMVLFVLLGLCSSGSVVLHAHARSVLPDSLIGRGMTFQNMAAIGGIFVTQVATGWIIGAFASGDGPLPEIAYRSAFGFLAVMVLLALAVYAGVKDVKPGETLAPDGSTVTNR